MRIVLSLLTGAGLAALFFTNPDADAFKDFVQTRSARAITAEAGENGFGQLMSRFGSRVAASVVNRRSDRADYYFFSVYTIDLGGDGGTDERWQFVGIGGSFFEMDVPSILREDGS